MSLPLVVSTCGTSSMKRTTTTTVQRTATVSEPTTTTTGAAPSTIARQSTATNMAAADPCTFAIDVAGSAGDGSPCRWGDSRPAHHLKNPDEVHIHSYDLFVDLEPGITAEVSFAADTFGVVEIETHDSALEIANLEAVVRLRRQLTVGVVLVPTVEATGALPAARTGQSSRRSGSAGRFCGGEQGGRGADSCRVGDAVARRLHKVPPGLDLLGSFRPRVGSVRLADGVATSRLSESPGPGCSTCSRESSGSCLSHDRGLADFPRERAAASQHAMVVPRVILTGLGLVTVAAA